MAEPKDNSIHPLKAIAEKFEIDNRKTKAVPKSSAEAATAEHSSFQRANALTLPLNDIQSPALLMDTDLCIIWQNSAAISQLWQGVEFLEKDTKCPHIFDRLFDAHFQSKIANWRQWAELFVQQARSLISDDKLHQAIAARNEMQRKVLQDLISDAKPQEVRFSFQTRLRQIHADGIVRIFTVMALTFDQGKLFVFDPATHDAAVQTLAYAVDLEQRMEMIRRNPQPVKISFHILAARLNIADILRAEMLDEEYGRLLHRIWKVSVETVEHYGGIVGQYTGDGLVGCFLPNDENQTQSTILIRCALELKSRMGELSREWKIRKGWLHNIELNIGIHAGAGYLATVRSSLSADSLMPMGDTVQIAGYLSSMAAKGQIWATKEVINQISPEDLKHVRFGIFRQDGNRQVFIARCFSRIRDLSNGINEPFNSSGDLGAQAVTQIFDRSGHMK